MRAHVFQYAGYYEHGRSGLNLTKTRAYNPGLGRFISRDPDDEDDDDPEINLYEYADNQPITLIDPDGAAPMMAPPPAPAPGGAPSGGDDDKKRRKRSRKTGERPKCRTTDEPIERAKERDNKQADDAKKAIEKQIGRELSKDEKRQLHDWIPGERMTYHEIVEEGANLFKRK